MSRKRPPGLAACLFLLGIVAPAASQAPGPGSGWREDPAFVPLFTPSHVPKGRYRTWVSDRPLDELLNGLRTEDAPPGAWRPEGVAPADAFGRSGRYDRWKVARLYRATLARVARGPHMDRGELAETWTLISPYPDPSLQRLHPGTLLITLRLKPIIGP